MKLIFDVSKPALTQQQLAEERAQCQSALEGLRKKRLHSGWLAVVLSAAAFAFFLLIRQDGLNAFLYYLLPLLAFVTALVLIAASSDGVVVLLGFSTGWLMAFPFAGFAGSVANPAVRETVLVSMGAIVVFAFTIWTYYFVKWVTWPHCEITRRQFALKELVPDEHPDHCIAYLKMVEEDEALQTYQSQINTMGRRPTMGDFWVAQDWIAGRPARLEAAAKRSQAVEACAKFGATVYGGQVVAAH